MGDGAFDGLDAAWDQLFGVATDPHPYLARAWARSWWDEFGRGPRRAAARAVLHVVAVWRGPALVGLVPLAAIGGGRASPLRILIGVGQENADYGGALVADGDDEALEAVAAALAELVAQRRTLLALARLRASAPLLGALGAVVDPDRFALASLEQEPYPYLDLRDEADPDAAIARLIKRNDVARRSRRLAELGEVRWVEHCAQSAGDGFDAFLALHRARWADRGAVGPFATPRGQRFLARATAGLDELGVLRLAFLTLDGRPIAARYGAVCGRWYFGMKSGWDPALATYGLGHLMVAKRLEQVRRDGLDGFDFLRGAGAHKQAWTPRSHEVGWWVVGRRGRGATIDREVLRAIQRLRHRWRSSPLAAPQPGAVAWRAQGLRSPRALAAGAGQEGIILA